MSKPKGGMSKPKYNVQLAGYLLDQEQWSERVFGKGHRTIGICEHIQKELEEIKANPADVTEWIDVMILAMDGYWRAGGDPCDLWRRLVDKQRINFNRSWPPPGPQDQPTEHIRSIESPTATPAECPTCGKESTFRIRYDRSCEDPGYADFTEYFVCNICGAQTDQDELDRINQHAKSKRNYR